MKTKMTFETTTPKGTEGHNISYGDEVRCAESLKYVLPEGWKVLFSWAQILFSDVQYNIDKKKKVVNVVYNQNLTYWWPQLKEELTGKLKDLKVI